MRARIKLLLTVWTLGLSFSAQAALVENLAVSPRAMSLGNAVTADPGGVESIHFNPAGLARLKGVQLHTTLFVAKELLWGRVSKPPDFEGIAGFTDLTGADGKRHESRDHALYIPGHGLTKPHIGMIAAPYIGFSYSKPGSNVTFADFFYITQAVAYDRSDNTDDPTHFDGRTFVGHRINYLAPGIGYQISDSLSVGASLVIGHQALALNTDFRAPNLLVGILGQLQRAFCGDNANNPLDVLLLGLCQGGTEGYLHPYKNAANLQFELSAPLDVLYHVGVLWEPVDWFAFGAVYQGESVPRLTGRYQIRAAPMISLFIRGLNNSLLGPIVGTILGLPTNVPAVETGNVTLQLPYPAHAQLGIKVKPFRRLQINVDANWTNWSAWDKLQFDFDKEIEILKIARLFGEPNAAQLNFPRGYRNVVHFGFGVQIQATDKLTLRLGYEPRKSSIPLDKIDLLAPLPDLKLYGLGFGYQLNKRVEIDFAAAYIVGEFRAPAETSSNANRSNFLNLLYNPYAKLDIEGGVSIPYVGFTWRQTF